MYNAWEGERNERTLANRERKWGVESLRLEEEKIASQEGFDLTLSGVSTNVSALLTTDGFTQGCSIGIHNPTAPFAGEVLFTKG